MPNNWRSLRRGPSGHRLLHPEAGLRNLEREIASLCRGVAREIAEGLKTQVAVNEADIAQYLGPPKFFPDRRSLNTPGARGGHRPRLDPQRRRHPLHRGLENAGQGRPSISPGS